MKSFRWANILIIIVIFPLSYFISFSLIQLYVRGDQIHYRAFYEAISMVSFSEAFVLARGYVDAAEPLTIFLLWAGSYLGIPKDYYISFFNATLLTLIVLMLKKYRAGLLVTLLFMTNFYVIVLMTGAERLKFSYILLVSAILLNGYARGLSILLAPLAHFQSLLFLPSVLIARFYNELKFFFTRGVVNKKKFYIYLITIICIFIIIFYFYPSLERKGQAYLKVDRDVIAFLNLIILTFVSVVASKNWKRIFVLLLPCYPIVFLFGGERGNMIAVTIALWALMLERRLNHPLILVILFYFSWKSIGFINNVLLYGNGFA